MQETKPILSVITINYNDLQGLKRTLESVSAQSFRNFEYIVIDGGSSDGSATYLETQKNELSFWCSEKDAGIYDAQNKGIKESTGNYLLFLNAGDTFYDNTVTEKFAAFYSKQSKGIIYGNSHIISGAGKDRMLIPPDQLDLGFWYRNTLNHQAVFIQRSLFDVYGLYNTFYRICADFDFFLKVYVKENESFVHFSETVCNYYEEGFSADPANYDKMLAEKEQILKAHLNPVQYAHVKRSYIKTLPLKKQVLSYIYEKPVLNAVFKKLYPDPKREKK